MMLLTSMDDDTYSDIGKTWHRVWEGPILREEKRGVNRLLMLDNDSKSTPAPMVDSDLSIYGITVVDCTCHG